MHSTLLDLIFGVIGASFVVHGAMLLAAFGLFHRSKSKCCFIHGCGEGFRTVTFPHLRRHCSTRSMERISRVAISAATC